MNGGQRSSTALATDTVFERLFKFLEEAVFFNFRDKAHVGDIFVLELANLRILFTEARYQRLDACPAHVRNRIEGVAKLIVGIVENIGILQTRILLNRSDTQLTIGS